ncbi:MAG: hypothetical protein WC873_01285 [Candidatus Gracilibacteria bacterium]
MKKFFPILAALFLLTVFGCQSQPASDQQSDQPKVEDNLNADAVLDNQIFYAATKTNDADRCKKILDAAKLVECQSIVDANLKTEEAVAQLNKSLCKKISLDRYADYCNEAVSQAIAEAEASAEGDQFIADQLKLSQETVANDDLEGCAKIEDENFRNDCIVNISISLAQKSNDVNACNNIEDQALKDFCKRQVSE